jgi:uncharacterized membrane protein YkvA (DUF1232 family)
MMQRWKQQLKLLKQETYTIYIACKDPRVPWYARLLASAVVAYAFSPIDLIPDVIPVIGYLDDLILVPLGIALVIKMIPPHVLAECQEKAATAMAEGKPTNWVAAIIVVCLWFLLGIAAVVWLKGIFG